MIKGKSVPSQNKFTQCWLSLLLPDKSLNVSKFLNPDALHQPAMIGLPELEGGQHSRLQQIRAQLQSFSEFILI